MPSLVSNWDLDGFVDEQRYYCSETPIDHENLPVPKAVLAGDVRTYTDTVIDTGKTYYVAVGSVKNGVEKVGDEIEVLSLDEYANIYLRLKNDIIDNGLTPQLFINNSVVFEDGSAKFNSIDSYIRSSQKLNILNFGTGDFDIEVAATVNGQSEQCLLDMRNLMDVGNPSPSDYANILRIKDNKLVWSNGLVLREVTFPFIQNNLYAFKVNRVAGVLRMFIDGIKLLEVTETTNISNDRYLHIGVGRTTQSGFESQYSGAIRKVRITKGRAIHTSDYTITYQR